MGMDFQKIIKNFKLATSKNSPTILTTMAVGGLLTTTIMAVKATPKALRILEEAEDEKDDELTRIEALKVAYKCYIPAAIMGLATATCIISANNINMRRNAIFASLYTITDTTLKEYQAKVKDVIGEKAEKKIKGEIAQDHLDKTPLSKSTVVMTNKGDTLCFDKSSGRYFRTDIDKLKRAENDLTKILLRDMWISLNDVYYEMGLDGIGIGSEIGWNLCDTFELEYTAKLADDGQPCIVVDFVNAPSGPYRN